MLVLDFESSVSETRQDCLETHTSQSVLFFKIDNPTRNYYVIVIQDMLTFLYDFAWKTKNKHMQLYKFYIGQVSFLLKILFVSIYYSMYVTKLLYFCKS
jgi:hypothetical protein